MLGVNFFQDKTPYVDFEKLPYYREEYYDESGDTELLYATGALELAEIKEEHNTYRLSKLGVKLLNYGCNENISDCVQSNQGTKIEQLQWGSIDNDTETWHVGKDKI